MTVTATPTATATATATATQKRPQQSHWVTYPRFLFRALRQSAEGSPLFYAWMTVLTCICLVGVSAWAQQLQDGMITTNMTDHVSWGLYIANFTFFVGVAAGGVMMVIPAYLYHDEKMHAVTILGELLAVAAICVCLLFVVVDLGRPDRAWHMLPGIGRFNFPISMLTWDVLVLNGYLLLNLHVCGYLLYKAFLGQRPNPRFYVPVVMLSIVWAISIHTVTAFLYCGLGGRPFWNSALLAPRFLTSAFVAGPAFLIVTMLLLKKALHLPLSSRPIQTLIKIVRVTTLINLLMLASEVFTEFQTGGSHSAPARYLFFGLHGHNALVPWIWTAIAMNVLAAVLFLTPRAMTSAWVAVTASVMAFAACWIEKGMGLIVPGFVPSTLHEVVEYTPSLIEWKVSAGIFAFGLMIYTIALKVAVPILSKRAALTSDS